MPVQLMDDLIPPKENPAVTFAAKLILPAFLRWQKLHVRPTDRCVDTIRRFQGQQTVLLLNHPDRYDPVMAFALSALLGEDFYYLAARELFDQKFSGWFLQNCGAYSVIRGFPADIASKELTISLISHGKRKLIEFPEGDVTGNDDHIFPLKRDGLLNMLEAQRRLNIETPGRSIFLLPMSTLYEVHPSAISDIEGGMRQLGSKLGTNLPARDSMQPGIVKLLSSLIERLRYNYAIDEPLPSSIDGALRLICRIIIFKLADSAGVFLESEPSEAELLYNLRSSLRKSSAHHDKDLERLQQLLITANTLEQPFTKEVAWRVVDRLETLVTGQFTIKGWRTAWVDSSAPIDLRDFINKKTTAPEDAVDELERIVYGAMNATLRGLKSRRHTSRMASLR